MTLEIRKRHAIEQNIGERPLSSRDVGLPKGRAAAFNFSEWEKHCPETLFLPDEVNREAMCFGLRTLPVFRRRSPVLQ
jgi:hypothetical protein